MFGIVGLRGEALPGGEHKEKSLKRELTELIKPLLLSYHHHAEKMKRQKLYSNVIREQNKNISRIPFLLAKDPEGSDKKVPRMKVCVFIFLSVCVLV